MSCHRSLFMFRRAFHAAAPLELAAQLEAFAAAGEQVKPAGEGRKMQVGGWVWVRRVPRRLGSVDCIGCAADPHTYVSTTPHSV